MDLLTQTAPYISTSAAVGTLLIVLFLIARGGLIPGAVHREMHNRSMERLREMNEDRDFWREIALESMNALGATVSRQPEE